MNMQKFTQKSLEALQNAQQIAIQNQNSQIEQEHLMLALINDENGLIKELLEKMKISKEFKAQIEKAVKNKPKIISNTNQNESIYVSQDLEQALIEAEKIANNMKDEYVSVEHIMLGIIDKANRELANLLKTFNITKSKFLKR